MAKPVWQTEGKGSAAEALVRLCAGRDVRGLPPVDEALLASDLWTNRAHAQVLHRAGVLTTDELRAILASLRDLEAEAEDGSWSLDPACEDVHMAVEQYVSQRAGDDVGGKLHSGRSRNDQVATDMRLWLRDALLALHGEIDGLVATLLDCASDHVETVMPGWTHQRPAMVTSWGSVLAGYASALERDMDRLLSVFARINACPLGAAAGYGTSWSLDRSYAARLLGFARVLEHPGDAAGNRWEPDADAATAIALFMRHLATLAQDWITLSSPAYGFIGLPKQLTTGSSIMPQKRNPDLLEVTRAKCAIAIGTATSLMSLGANEMSGYQRDLQWSKYLIMDLIREVSGLAPLLGEMLSGLDVRAEQMAEDCKTGFIEAVDVADTLARSRNVPFRTAYGVISDAVAIAEKDAQGQRLTRAALDAALSAQAMAPLSDSEAAPVEDPASGLAARCNVGGPAPAQTRELIESLRKRSVEWARLREAKVQHLEQCRVACRKAVDALDKDSLPTPSHTRGFSRELL